MLRLRALGDLPLVPEPGTELHVQQLADQLHPVTVPGQQSNTTM